MFDSSWCLNNYWYTGIPGLMQGSNGKTEGKAILNML